MGSYRSYRSDSGNESDEDANVYGARQDLANLNLSPSPTAPNVRGGSQSPRPSTSSRASTSQTSFTEPNTQPYSGEQYALPTPITQPVPYGGGQYSAQAAVDRPIAPLYNAGQYSAQAAVDRPIAPQFNAGLYTPQDSTSNLFPPPHDSSETMPAPAEKKRNKLRGSYLHF